MAVGHGGVGTQLWLFHRTALSNNSTWLFRAFQNKICTKSVFYTSFSSLIPLACFCNMVSTNALKLAKRMQLLSISCRFLTFQFFICSFLCYIEHIFQVVLEGLLSGAPTGRLHFIHIFLLFLRHMDANFAKANIALKMIHVFLWLLKLQLF